MGRTALCPACGRGELNPNMCRVLRSKLQFMEARRIFKGEERVTYNLRKYYLYTFKPEEGKSVKIDGVLLVLYEKRIPRLNKVKFIY